MLRVFRGILFAAAVGLGILGCGSSSENKVQNASGGASGNGGSTSGGSGGSGGTASGGASGSSGGAAPGGSGGTSDGGSGGSSGAAGAPGCAFPHTPVLDDFNRADGVVGGQWPANPASNAFALQSGRLVKTTNETILQSMLWPTLFGEEQEAFVTLTSVDPDFQEMILTLKAQTPSSSCQSISVLYAPDDGQVQVWYCDTGTNWKQQGVKAVLFAPGDRLGARVHATGVVEVFQNEEKIAEYDLSVWSGSTKTGYIGISADMLGLVDGYDDFGGGNVTCPTD